MSGLIGLSLAAVADARQLLIKTGQSCGEFDFVRRWAGRLLIAAMLIIPCASHAKDTRFDASARPEKAPSPSKAGGTILMALAQVKIAQRSSYAPNSLILLKRFDRTRCRSQDALRCCKSAGLAGSCVIGSALLG